MEEARQPLTLQDLLSREEALDVLIEETGWDKKILVVARNNQCFTNWCYKVGLPLRHPLLHYIRGPQSMRGYDPKRTVIVLVCDWRVGETRKDNDEVMHTIEFFRNLGTEVLWDECARR